MSSSKTLNNQDTFFPPFQPHPAISSISDVRDNNFVSQITKHFSFKLFSNYLKRNTEKYSNSLSPSKINNAKIITFGL